MIHQTRQQHILRTALYVGVVAMLATSMVVPGLVGAASDAPAVATGPAAYQGKLTCCAHLVLGPQSNPTIVVQTPPLPAGKYLVNAIAGAVIADHDQIVCAVAPSNQPGTNDGIFGSAGNGAGTMGDGGFIYGTAPIADAWQITTAGTSLVMGCNAFNYGLGTYVGSASITALKVGSLTTQ